MQSSKEINGMLFEATMDGDLEKVVKSLILGANPNVKNEFGLTPLHLSIHKRNIDITDSLLEMGADPNSKAIGEWSPLHEAAFIGEIDAIKLLLDKGADVNALTTLKKSPILSMITN